MSEGTTVDSAAGSGERPGVSRRQVVRAGAAAAWTVPMVQLVTAAPAFAVSGPAKLGIAGFAVSRSGQFLNVSVPAVKNTGGTPTGQVTLVLRVPKRPGALSQPPTLASKVPAGWTMVGRTGSGPWDYTFLSHTGVAPGAGTPSLAIKLKLATPVTRWPDAMFVATAFAKGVRATSAYLTLRER